MDDLPPLRKATRIVDAVYHTLREAIISGRLKAAQQLSVPELARRLTVSRSPVREAVLQLVADGLAREQPRKGVVVVTIDLPDLLEIHEIREMTEALSARLCAERIDAHGVQALREIIETQQRCVEQDDAAGYFETNSAFHAAIADFARNHRLKDIVASLEGQMRIGLRKVSSDSGQRRDGIVEHSRIVDAIERRDGSEAERLMRQHIAQTKERLARLLRSELASDAA